MSLPTIGRVLVVEDDPPAGWDSDPLDGLRRFLRRRRLSARVSSARRSTLRPRICMPCRRLRRMRSRRSLLSSELIMCLLSAGCARSRPRVGDQGSPSVRITRKSPDPFDRWFAGQGYRTLFARTGFFATNLTNGYEFLRMGSFVPIRFNM